MSRSLLAAGAVASMLWLGGSLAVAAPDTSAPGAPGTDGEAEQPACVVAPDQPAQTAQPEPPNAPTGVVTTTSGGLSIPLPEGGGAGSVAAGSSVPLDQTIVLGRDGLGVVGFCEDADTTIAVMTALAGPADDDTGWVDPFSISACPGTVARRVTWGSLDLYFGDESPFASGRPHLFGYSYGNIDGFDVAPPGLVTPEGVGLGTSVDDLLAAYPAVSLIPGEEGIGEPVFYVDETLRGLLTDTTGDGVVTLIIGGEACGV